jgi:hypothetical protein
MHESDISELEPEPQGSGEALEESGEVIKDPDNSPAIAQDSTSLEPLAGELLGDAPGAEDEAPQQYGPKRMRESGMSSEAVMRVCIERCKELAGPRHTILSMPPHYHVRGERAVLVSGRKRPITALDETPEFSSVGDDSVSTEALGRPDSAVLQSWIGKMNGEAPETPQVVSQRCLPLNEGDRGGGFAPAHRRNLDAAHSNNQALFEVIAAARQRNASSGNAAAGRPSMPAQEGESWGGSAPAQSNNFNPAPGNNYYEPTPYGYTPVDYEPLSPWEGEGEADARNDRAPPADSLTPPWRGEQGGAAQMAALPQAAHSAAGRSTGLLSVGLLRPVLDREITQTPTATGGRCQKPQGDS